MDREILVQKILLQLGWISSKDLKEVILSQEYQKSSLLLEEFLVEKGILETSHIQRLYQKMKPIPWTEDIALYQYLRSLGTKIQPHILEEALKLAEKKNLSLGQILMKERRITAQEFLSYREKILQLQKQCSHCGKKYLPNPHVEGLLCSCGTVILNRANNPTKQTFLFGDYEIYQEIARGGMGVVYKAVHLPDKNLVALKVLMDTSVQQGVGVERFFQEASTAQKLKHPNIVEILDFGNMQGKLFLAMEFIEGISLRKKIEREPLSFEEGVNILLQICDAVHFAHSQNIIHRDLKSSNILVNDQGHAWLTDFGLAKDLENSGMITQTGVKIGTPAYMSPEQAEGNSKYANQFTDIYQMGILLFQIFTGKLPFQGKTPAELFYKIIYEEPPSPLEIQPNLPLGLDKVFWKAVAKSPLERYPSVQELAADLKRIQQGKLPMLAKNKSSLSVSHRLRSKSFRNKIHTREPERHSLKNIPLFIWIVFWGILVLLVVLFFI